MKYRSIIALFLFALLLTCCTSKEEQVTEQYINVNLEELFANTDCSVKVSNWNKHPIDTITKDDIYRYYIRKLRGEAEYNRKLRDVCGDLISSCQDIIRHSRNLGVSYSWILDDKRKAERDYSKHNKLYLEALKSVEALEMKVDGDELFILAYPFSVTLTTHDGFLEQDVTSQVSCYSYIKIATDEVIAILFGDEYERDLSMIPLSLVLDEEDW